MTRTAYCFALATMLSVPMAGHGVEQPAESCTLGVNAYVGYNVQNKVGEPYSATVKTTLEQTLPNGNSIHGSVRVRQARDSSGKMYSETAAGCERGEDGQPHLRMQVNVTDPVARTNMHWSVEDRAPKVVDLYHYSEVVRPKLSPEEMAVRVKAERMRRPSRSEWHTEDLGMKTIAGVTARGSRSVRTIPAGEEGNALPLEVIDESWNSPELRLMLMQIHDDPRRGKVTTELEDLSLSEPSAALFAAPQGYEVKERHPAVEATGQQ